MDYLDSCYSFVITPSNFCYQQLKLELEQPGQQLTITIELLKQLFIEQLIVQLITRRLLITMQQLTIAIIAIVATTITAVVIIAALIVAIIGAIIATLIAATITAIIATIIVVTKLISQLLKVLQLIRLFQLVYSQFIMITCSSEFDLHLKFLGNHLYSDYFVPSFGSN